MTQLTRRVTRSIHSEGTTSTSVSHPNPHSSTTVLGWYSTCPDMDSAWMATLYEAYRQATSSHVSHPNPHSYAPRLLCLQFKVEALFEQEASWPFSAYMR